MRPDERDVAYLWDMMDAAEDACEFCRGHSFVTYTKDKKLRAAVERKIEIVGEAARRVSATGREDHPDIPWRSLIGLRNVLAHEYDEVRHEIIWRAATIRAPELVEKLRTILVPPG